MSSQTFLEESKQAIGADSLSGFNNTESLMPPPEPPPASIKLLIFSYDLTGNQKQRFYCPNAGSCSVPNPSAGKIVKEKEVVEENIEESDSNNQLEIYPNPTKDIVHIYVQSKLLSEIESVNVYNINSSLVKTLKINKSKNQVLEIDLTGKSAGIYFIHIHMNNGSPSITKKIIKE